MIYLLKTTLLKAYSVATSGVETHCTQVCGNLIDFVLDNNHKTYKYVLFTALAAKATDERVNMLCLQAGSSLDGAYDARSICHHVIVKFEMTTLGKALGGSNEPFLNKPARFPELNKSNAVRKGNDQEILNCLCDNLPLIKTKGEAFNGLVYAIKKLLKVKEEKGELNTTGQE